MATERWRALGYTLLRLICDAYAVGYYVCYVLPRCAWLRVTGQIPRTPRDPQTWQSHEKEGKF
jgi:hypothetical protein